MTINAENSSTPQSHSEKPFTLKLMDEIVANSSLKVDAPEFIPRSYESKPMAAQTSSVQDRLKIHRSEPECEKNDIVEHNMTYGIQYTDVDVENDLKRIRQIINTLTKDPGQFDNLLQIFMDTVMPNLEDFIVLSDIAQILINEVSNFIESVSVLCTVMIRRIVINYVLLFGNKIFL